LWREANFFVLQHVVNREALRALYALGISKERGKSRIAERAFI
jgi:hypothetical protein